MVQLSTPAATGRHDAHTLAGVLHLWRRDASQGAWRAVELPEEGVALCRSVERDLRARGDAVEHICALIVPFEEAGATRAVLLTSPCSDGAVLRNGAPVLGVVVLDQELDEIGVYGETVYLSARGPVASAPFPGPRAPAPSSTAASVRWSWAAWRFRRCSPCSSCRRC